MIARVKNRSLGQGMTEYLIIIALIAITSIGVMRIFGSSIKFQMAESITAFLGNDKSKIKRPRLTKSAAKDRTMRDFARAADR